MIIAGERRYSACKLLGLSEVRCEVIEGTPQSKLLVMAVENLQRKDLTIVEEGEIFESLKTAYGVGMSNRKTASLLGVSPQRVDFAINAYTKLSPQVQLMVQSKEITEESTRALTKLSKEPEVQLNPLGINKTCRYFSRSVVILQFLAVLTQFLA